MPRPGPRPYECVRRSWHSDLHQPVRGSIIQQIFRVVHENHSIGTKKNREWQEKLPLVVFKSEEIIYSKASSEAEYIDPDTLWDRVNDAINIIIRKDETMETGELLPPCVEAALNLGCFPVRTSRSQRNSNTRSYLGPRNQDPEATLPKTADTSANARNLILPYRERPIAMNQTETNMNSRQNYQIAAPGSSFYPRSIMNFPTPTISVESKSASSSSSSSVYPLYYGLHFQPQNLRGVFSTTHQNSKPIIVGTPVFRTAHEPLPPPLMNFLETSFSSKSSKKMMIHEEQPSSQPGCDLSLSLGLVSGNGKGLTSVNDVGSGPSSSWVNPQEFSFFPLNSEGEQVHELVADVRKRKAAAAVEDGQHSLRLEPGFNQKRRGL